MRRTSIFLTIEIGTCPVPLDFLSVCRCYQIHQQKKASIKPTMQAPMQYEKVSQQLGYHKALKN